MPTTLTHGATVLTLPEDLIWIDEFDWHPVEGRMTRSALGAVLFDRGTKIDGRPMTLAGDGLHSWITRTLAVSLYALASIADAQIVLAYRSTTFDVVFDHTRNPLELRPVADWPEYEAGDFYTVLMRLLQKA